MPADGPTGADSPPRDRRHPVDIALDAGMRPMLIRHGFRRKTKRCYVRETVNSLQLVRIFAGNRRGYQGAAFGACGCVLIKKLVKLGEELQLGRLDPPVRSTDHECHMTCDLNDYHSFFNIKPFRREMRKKHFILRMFRKGPDIEEKIPEILTLRELYSKFEDKIDQPESVPLIGDYGRERADIFGKYILPWFNECDDISFAVQWIYEMGGKKYRTGNLLLAAAGCLAGDMDMAVPQLQKMIHAGKISRQEHYKKALLDERKRYGNSRKVQRRTEKFANKYADFAFGIFQDYARKSKTLADRFGVQID